MSFITAVSSEGCASSSQIDDISPAQFKVLFDAPIEIQNVDLELNSCKVSQLNRINIIENRNTIIFRLGDASDQYKAVIPTGNYLATDLANKIAESMNAVVPTNNYKGFSAAISSGGAIEITYSLTAVPDESVFALQSDNFTSEGPVESIEATKGGAGQGDSVLYQYPQSQLTTNVSNFKRPNDTFEFCGPLDVGAALGNSKGIDDDTRTAFSNYGIWEESRNSDSGTYDAVIQPVDCVTNSNFERGYGGLGGSFAGNSYFTIELEPTKFEDGTEVPESDLFHFGTLFSKSTLKQNEPRRIATKNALQINGVMNKARANVNNDGRGAPYKASKEFFFPTNVSNTLSNNRRLKYTTNWSGQLVMQSGSAGRPILNEPFPTGYTFQMDDSTGSALRKQAHSKVKQYGKEFERIRIRPSRSTLMKGLFQQDALNSDTVNDTDCTIGYIGTNPATKRIKYIAGSVGQVNTKNMNFLNTNNQNAEPTIENSFVYTYYKIIAVDGNGQPTQVKLVDGGEHVIAFDNTDIDTQKITCMLLNDPNTYNIVDSTFNVSDLTDTEIIDNFVNINVAAGDISEDVNAGNLTTQFDSRYPTFNMGLMANNIYMNNQVGFYHSGSNAPYSEINNKNPILNPLFVPKNYEIDIATNFAKSNTNALKVNIYQYQPTDESDEFESQPNQFLDNKKIIFNGFSETWNTLAGDGAALSAWTTFDATNSAGAVKISFETLDTYTYSIKLSHCLNFTTIAASNFIQEVELTKTGVTRGSSGSAKNEALLKIRDFPLQPIFSSGTGTIKEGSAAAFTRTHISSRGSVYDDNNFNRNLANRVVGTNEINFTKYNVPQVSAPSGPTAQPDGQKVPIMIKTAPLEKSQISSTPVAVPSTGLCNLQDFDPNANLLNLGLHSVMYGQLGRTGTSFDFRTDAAASLLSYLPSFAVEINLPVKSYIGKNYTLGKVENAVGSGIKSQIVGICPGTKFVASTTTQSNDYTYTMEYSKPVQIRLPNKTTFYSLDITLRDILTGKILKNLVHSTEVVLRMYDLMK